MQVLKKLFLLIYFLYFPPVVFAANQSSQVLTSNLPEVLEIEKIIVEDIEHDKNEELKNIKIETIDKLRQDYYVVALTPIKVKIHTNLSSPIVVNAEFTGLRHAQQNYDFSEFNLSIFPASYTITQPYDHITTNSFTPFAIVRPDTVLGDYNGTILFTLGVL